MSHQFSVQACPWYPSGVFDFRGYIYYKGKRSFYIRGYRDLSLRVVTKSRVILSTKPRQKNGTVVMFDAVGREVARFRKSRSVVKLAPYRIHVGDSEYDLPVSNTVHMDDWGITIRERYFTPMEVDVEQSRHALLGIGILAFCLVFRYCTVTE